MSDYESHKCEQCAHGIYDSHSGLWECGSGCIDPEQCEFDFKRSDINPRELRIIVAGGRDFDDFDLLRDSILNYLCEIDGTGTVHNPSQIKFISGTARGADVFGEQFAYTYGYDVIRFPADWDRYGKSAGYRRNTEMAKYASEEGNTGVLIAFWNGRSRGTKNMIDLGKRYGLDVHVLKY